LESSSEGEKLSTEEAKYPCSFCGESYKSKAGKLAHERFKHSQEREEGANSKLIVPKQTEVGVVAGGRNVGTTGSSPFIVLEETATSDETKSVGKIFGKESKVSAGRVMVELSAIPKQVALDPIVFLLYNLALKRGFTGDIGLFICQTVRDYFEEHGARVSITYGSEEVI